MLDVGTSCEMFMKASTNLSHSYKLCEFYLEFFVRIGNVNRYIWFSDNDNLFDYRWNCCFALLFRL